MFSSSKRLVRVCAAFALALALLLGAVTTSRADSDYHWLDTFGNYDDSPASQVTAFAFSPGGNLYIGGAFTDAGGVTVNGTAMWDGAAWHALGGGFGVNFGVLPSVSKIIAVSDTEVYYAGFFATLTNAPSNNCAAETVYVYHIALWDGTCWHGLGPDADHLGVRVPAYSDIGDMEFFEGKLWVTGLFHYAGNVEAHGIATWNGIEWEAVAAGPDFGMSGNGYGGALAIDGTTLYIGGSFSGLAGIPTANVAAYRDGTFEAVGGGLEGLNVSALLASNGVVYAGGSAQDSVSPSLWVFTESNGWSVLGGGVGLSSGSGHVSALAWQNNQLYVGGSFGSAGQITALNLALWDTQTQSWSEFGNPIGYPSGSVNDILFRNGRVYIAGDFTQVGGKQSLHLGIYDPNATPPPPQADLNVELSLSDDPVDSGAQVAVCIAVSNYGPDAATGVTMTSQLPEGAAFQQITFDGCSGGGGETLRQGRVNGLAYPALVPNCQTPNVGDAGMITCALDDLQPYDSTPIRIDFIVTAAPGAALDLGASVFGNELAPQQNNNAAAQTLHTRPNVIYASPDADCGIFTPCVSSLNDALGQVMENGTVQILTGTYNESLYYSKNVTLQLDGDVALSGDLYIGAGAFHASANQFSIGGSLTLDNASFSHNGGGVRLNGNYAQSVSGNFTFHNLTIANGATVQLQNPVTIVGVLNNQGTLIYPPQTQDIPANMPVTFTDGLNQAAVEMTAQDALGMTTVAVTSGQTPPDCNGSPFPSAVTPLRRHFDITPGAYGIPTTLTLYYADAELNNVDEQTIRVYHCGYNPATDSYEWTLLANSAANGVNNSVQVNGVTDFSPFALGGSPAAPTSATLVSVQVKPHKKGGAQVQWETGSEMNVVGFHVYRSAKANGTFKPLNVKLKPAKNMGQIMGSKYTWHDAQVKSGKRYYYRVQVVLADDKVEWSDTLKFQVP